MEQTKITLKPVKDALLKVRRELVELRESASTERKKTITEKIVRVDKLLAAVRTPPCRAFSGI